MLLADDAPYSQTDTVSHELLEADLGRKLFAAAAAAIVIGAVAVAFRKPFGDGRHGEYVYVGVGALIAFGKVAFESLRHHRRWRRLRRAASS
jgi:hypothetical protein